MKGKMIKISVLVVLFLVAVMLGWWATTIVTAQPPGVGGVQLATGNCIIGFTSNPTQVTATTKSYTCKSMKPACKTGYSIGFQKFDGSVFTYTCYKPEG